MIVKKKRDDFFTVCSKHHVPGYLESDEVLVGNIVHFDIF